MSSAAVSSEKPTILFVPGAWHLPAGFDPVREYLDPLGYPTEAVAHPSIGEEPPKANLIDDTANLRAAIEKLVDAGKQVVVVAHSYGGLVSSCAVENLGFSQRKSSGKNGGVIQLVYLTAFALPKGGSLLGALGGNWLPWMKVKGDYTYADEPERIFYHDLPEVEQKKWIAQLTHSATAVFSGQATYEPWHDIPCSYIFCDQDAAVPLAVQEGIASGLGSDITTFHIDASHSPFVSQPKKLAEAVEVAAKVGLAKIQA